MHTGRVITKQWGGVLGVVAGMLLLCGCTPAPPDIPGPTTRELADFSQRQLSRLWDDMAVPEGLERPEIEPVRTISNAEYGTVINDCLDGFRDRKYRNLYGHELIAEQPLSSQVGINENVSWYVCSARYPFDPTGSGYFSVQQLVYLYDYDRRWVIPCMVLGGYDVGEIPDQAEFIRRGVSGTVWSPLEGQFEDFGMTEQDYAELDARCDVYPDYLFPDL